MSEKVSAGGRILVTGASGYVGGRLLPRLEARGLPVRCLARRPEYLESRVRDSTEVVGADLLDAASLPAALRGIETAYYLVHSMGAKDDFEERDRQAALNFATAAREAGVRRVVYLGGLAEEDSSLSPHLRSRHEVGRVLRDSGLPVIEFRASIVIGSGSLSFEMIRSLVETLPVMVTPNWVRVQAQPISIQDLLGYLEHALEADASGNPIYEIGGADRMSYAELMMEYARQRGLRRTMIPVPVLTPGLQQPVAGTRDSALCAHRAQADREHQPLERRPRRSGAPRLWDRARERRGGHRVCASQRGPGVCRDAMVRRPILGRCRTRFLRWRARPRPSRRFANPSRLRTAGAELCADPTDRWSHRAGTHTSRCGASGDSSTCSWEAWGCGAVVTTPRNSTSATRWTGGG